MGKRESPAQLHRRFLETPCTGGGSERAAQKENKASLLTPEKPLCAWSPVRKHTGSLRAKLRNTFAVVS
ncbi:rCG37871, partial [Rattus norvegicus]